MSRRTACATRVAFGRCRFQPFGIIERPRQFGKSRARYDAMRSAIVACHSVDEAKDIQDRAAALQAYARQSRDPELERWVAEIRLQARRRIGELSAVLESARGRNSRMFHRRNIRGNQSCSLPQGRPTELLPSSALAQRPLDRLAVPSEILTAERPPGAERGKRGKLGG